MLNDDAALVDRLYDHLADALTRSRPSPFSAPVTVAEIYQELVPYRSVRDEVGFSMNADYEHVLMQLLAGEGAYARIEPDSARDEFIRELRSPNPNVSIYREYAGCDVWVRAPDESTEPAVEPQPATAGPATASPAAASAAPQRGGTADVEEEADRPQRPTALFRPPDDARQVPPIAAVDCVFCDTTLPLGRPVRYCPFCGGDQTLRPCPSCGEALERGWTYCVACGATTADGGASGGAGGGRSGDPGAP